MKHILYSNYFCENDEFGKDAYDYAREYLFEEDEEHKFSDEDYLIDPDQITIEDLKIYVCPICGEEFENLSDAKNCCRDQKWETEDDIPEDTVTQAVYLNDQFDFDEFKYSFGKFLKESNTGFILCGTCGRWNGRYNGGCFVNNFDDLYKFWKDCDYIKVYDENGHLYMKATHHDGTNYAELKELTNKGVEYKVKHYWDSDEETHNVIFNNNFYSKLPHYAHKMGL